MSDSKLSKHSSNTTEIVDSWPDWKKEYKLTKYSSGATNQEEEQEPAKNNMAKDKAGLAFC